MLNLTMGHQTSATYPSIKDLVSLSHLKIHSSTPPTPENCKIELREISNFMENFVANVVDDRAGTVNRKGKHYHWDPSHSHYFSSKYRTSSVTYHFGYCFGVV